MEPNPSHREQTQEQRERLAELWEAVLKLRAEPFLSQTVLIDILSGVGKIPPVEKPVWFLVEQFSSLARLPVEASLDEIALCRAYRKALYHYKSYEQRLAPSQSSVRQIRKKPTAPVTFLGNIRNLFRGILQAFLFWPALLWYFAPSLLVAAVLFLVGLILVFIVYL